MRSSKKFRFLFVDLSMIVAILLIGWAAFRLAKIELQTTGNLQQSQDLRGIFKECQELFQESINHPELARREFDLVWYDALNLKAEYLSIADRLESDLPELGIALEDASTRKSRAELPRRMQALKSWMGKQKDRIGFERIEIRSKELQGRVAGTQLARTNGPMAISKDLGTLLKEVDRAYESYLADFRKVADNEGKPLVAAFVAEHKDGAKKTLALIADLAHQARRDGRAIESFLEAQSRSDAAQGTRRQKEFIQAFLEVGSPEEFTRRIRSETAAGQSSPAASMFKVPALRQVRYVLLAALAGLGVLLIVDLYWRMVVMPLRFKLVERNTIIEQQAKLTHFEQLAAGLAHEIRNPLTAISARLYTIQRKLQEGTPEQKDGLVIGNEIDRVNQILKGFIQLTRPTPPKLAPMTAGPLLKEVSDLMAPLLEQQAVRLECQTEGHAQFYGDTQQLKQVLINLIHNAAESIERTGTIILRAREGAVPFKGTQTKVVIIEVEDSGPGIRPEVQGRLFEPFFSTKKEGTGLGLPISARIIDRHGGTLDFETQPGRGTIFRILLPIAHPAG